MQNNRNGNGDRISKEPQVVVVYDREDAENFPGSIGKWRSLQLRLQRTAREYWAYRQDTRELLRKKRIAADTNARLAMARARGLQDAYDFDVGTQKELALYTLAADLHAAGLKSELQRAEEKLDAINQATRMFRDKMSHTSDDLARCYDDIRLDAALAVLSELIGKILNADPDAREVVRKNCPRKRRSFLDSIF